MNRHASIWFALAILFLAAGCGVQSPLQVDTNAVPTATTKQPYVVGLTAQGGMLPLKWSLASGQLPAGVNLSSTTGLISGTPLTEGEFNFKVSVTDSGTPSLTAISPNLRLKVKSQIGAPLTVATLSLPGGTLQSAYSASVSATGGNVPYKWSVSAGSLPSGISLSQQGGLSGTPTATGKFSFTVQVQDSSAPPQRATHNLSISITSASSALQVATSSLPAGAVQLPYSAGLAASGGTAPYSWSLIGGTFPPGLAFSSAGGISGTPTQAGAFLFSTQLKDSTGQATSASLTINVAQASSPVVSSLSPNSGPTSGGTTVLINGSNLASGATVSFGGVAASAVVTSATQIQAVSPAHIAGTAQVIVQENGLSSSAINFTYNSVTPAISSISPTSGPTAGGTKVTITGSNFLAGALVVFGTVSASSVTVVSGTQLQVIAPANSAGPVNVSVQDPGSVTASLSAAYTYMSSNPPTISSVSPTSGSPGTQVTITGSNFTSSDIITFGSSQASSTYVSSTQLTALVPNVASGTYSVTVTDPDPSSATLSNSFTVTSTQAQSLLAGCTVSESSNAPSCTAPSGWTIVGAEGFGGGATHIGSGQSGSISTTQHHTGSYALGGLYSADGQVIADWIHPSVFSSYNDLYVSFWDYEDSNALIPQELYLGIVSNCDQGTCPSTYQDFGWDWQNVPGVSTTCASMVDIQDELGPGGNVNFYYENNLCINAGTWRQYEIWFHPNTVTNGVANSDGFLKLYVNGQLQSQKLSFSPNGLRGSGTGNQTPAMQNPGSSAFIEIGGVITAFCDSNAGTRANPFSLCPNAAPQPFHRYLDDIVIMKK